MRSLASVRSYFFREAILDVHSNALERYTLADFRDVWRRANAQAREWRRQATNRWNPSTRQWEQRQ